MLKLIIPTSRHEFLKLSILSVETCKSYHHGFLNVILCLFDAITLSSLVIFTCCVVALCTWLRCHRCTARCWMPGRQKCWNSSASTSRSWVCPPSNPTFNNRWGRLLERFVTPDGSRDSLLVERRTSDWKVAGSNPSSCSGRIFFFRVNIVLWLLFGVCFTPTLPQWHVKDPSHSCKSAGGRLHLNMHTPFTQQSWSALTMPLSRHSVGSYQDASSHATCHGTFGHSHLGSLSHCGLILVWRVELGCAS